MYWNNHEKCFVLTRPDVEQAIREFMTARRPELEVGRIAVNYRTTESRWHGTTGSVYNGHDVFVENAEVAESLVANQQG